MTAFKRFDEPHEVELDRIRPRYDKLGPLYKGKAGKIGKAMEASEPASIVNNVLTVEVDGESFSISGELFEVARVKEKVSGIRSVPHVIEPSHGLDRIIYTVLEHSFDQKDEQIIMHLSPAVAPIKVGVFPLMARDELDGHGGRSGAPVRCHRDLLR